MPILNDPTLSSPPITTTVLPGGVALAVDTSGMVLGGTYRVTGATADGLSWSVRGGVGTVTGDQVLLVDVLAPLNTTLVYTVTDGVDTWAASATVRPYAGWHVLGSLDGLIVVDVLRGKDGDQRTPMPRQATFDIPGKGFPVVRYDGATAGSGSMLMRTTGVDSAGLSSLVAAGRPVVALHNPKKCHLPQCDVPLAEIILLTAAPNRFSSRMDLAERIWELEYLLVADPEPGTPVPVTSWDDFDVAHEGTTWGGFDSTWAGRSWDELDRTVWDQAPS